MAFSVDLFTLDHKWLIYLKKGSTFSASTIEDSSKSLLRMFVKQWHARHFITRLGWGGLYDFYNGPWIYKCIELPLSILILLPLNTNEMSNLILDTTFWIILQKLYMIRRKTSESLIHVYKLLEWIQGFGYSQYVDIWQL